MSGGWDTYLDAGRFNAEQARLEKTRPPVECPIDGEPLEVVGNVRHCPAGNYMWPVTVIQPVL